MRVALLGTNEEQDQQFRVTLASKQIAKKRSSCAGLSVMSLIQLCCVNGPLYSYHDYLNDIHVDVSSAVLTLLTHLQLLRHNHSMGA